MILISNCKNLLEYHLDQHGYFVPAELQRHNLKYAKMKYNRVVSRESIYCSFLSKAKTNFTTFDQVRL